MTLRLVLISLVAGLGLGLPSWPTVEGWVAGAQKWMNARLAASDDRVGERHIIIHDLLAAEMQRAHAARQAHRSAAIPAIAPRPPIIAVEHSIAPRRLAATHAAPPPSLPLPKLDDYLTAAATEPRPEAGEPASTVSPMRLDDLAMLAWDRARPEGARLAAALAEGLREAAEIDRDARAFVAMEETGDLYFEADAEIAHEPAPLSGEAVAAIDGPEPVALEGPLPVALAAPDSVSGFEEMERTADLYFAAPIFDEPAAEATMIALAELPADVFAPDEPAAVVTPIVAAAPSPPSPEVNRAVRLTREALSAWVNVLTGPALVTAAHGGVIAR